MLLFTFNFPSLIEMVPECDPVGLNPFHSIIDFTLFAVYISAVDSATAAFSASLVSASFALSAKLVNEIKATTAKILKMMFSCQYFFVFV